MKVNICLRVLRNNKQVHYLSVVPDVNFTRKENDRDHLLLELGYQNLPNYDVHIDRRILEKANGSCWLSEVSSFMQSFLRKARIPKKCWTKVRRALRTDFFRLCSSSYKESILVFCNSL